MFPAAIALALGQGYPADAELVIGLVLFGAVYQWHGITGCLWVSTVFLLLAGILSIRLPEVAAQPRKA